MFIKFKNLKKTFAYSVSILVLLILCSCSKQEDPKTIENLNFDELKKRTLSSLENKKNDQAIAFLEKIVAEHPDKENIYEYKLMLADCYFDTGNLPSSYELYKHYYEFYPSDSKAEYATYRSILSKFYQTLQPDCDQSDTLQSINLCKNYLENTQFGQYQNDIKDIQHTCERKLIDKEVYVYNFYLKKGNYKAAKNRLTHLKKNYLDKNPSLDARLLFLESKLAQKEKDKTILNEKIEKLLDKYPNSHFTKMAQRLVNKTTFVF
ncbi:outer membrane protein assembly factor BamD [Candidatus Dependentiae bacterium]